MSSNPIHPDLEKLAGYRRGRLPAVEAVKVGIHVNQCPSCLQKMESIADDSLESAVRAMFASDESKLPPPELANHRNYRNLSWIGRSGMGAVYRADEEKMERSVAIKVINRRWTADPSAVERFRREMKAVGRLTHDNIVRAYVAGQEGDLHFLVMEYVEGVTLDRLVEGLQYRLPVGLACEYVRQAARALQHAHEHGIIHRDIKPQNMMLTKSGVVKVLDFGLASFLSRTGNEATITEVGQIMGTPAYMAPEQSQNSRVDIRADIYSLGGTLYHLLTGQPPSREGCVSDSLKEMRHELPAILVNILQWMMKRNPQERCGNLDRLLHALDPNRDRSLAAKPLDEVIAQMTVRISLDKPDYDAYLTRGDAYKLLGRHGFSDARKDYHWVLHCKRAAGDSLLVKDSHLHRGDLFLETNCDKRAFHDYAMCFSSPTGGESYVQFLTALCEKVNKAIANTEPAPGDYLTYFRRGSYHLIVAEILLRLEVENEGPYARFSCHLLVRDRDVRGEDELGRDQDEPGEDEDELPEWYENELLLDRVREGVGRFLSIEYEDDDERSIKKFDEWDQFNPVTEPPAWFQSCHSAIADFNQAKHFALGSNKAVTLLGLSEVKRQRAIQLRRVSRHFFGDLLKYPQVYYAELLAFVRERWNGRNEPSNAAYLGNFLLAIPNARDESVRKALVSIRDRVGIVDDSNRKDPDK